MASATVSTPLPDVGKLRPVLDYIPCETCLDQYTPEQEYFCAICVRLTREVLVKRTALGTDEAVQVLPPEDFSMARDLRDRIQQQEIELQEARAALSKLNNREDDLQEQLRRLQKELDEAKRQAEEAQLVPFEFVGVKEGARDQGLLEFQEEERPPQPGQRPAPPIAWEPAPEETGEPMRTVEPAPEAPALQWQPVEEEPQPEAPKWEEIPEEAAVVEPTVLPPPAPEPEPEPVAAPAPPPAAKPASPTTDDAIARIEAEIAKIEQELQQVSEQEKRLSEKTSKKKKK